MLSTTHTGRAVNQTPMGVPSGWSRRGAMAANLRTTQLMATTITVMNANSAIGDANHGCSCARAPRISQTAATRAPSTAPAAIVAHASVITTRGQPPARTRRRAMSSHTVAPSSENRPPSATPVPIDMRNAVRSSTEKYIERAGAASSVGRASTPSTTSSTVSPVRASASDVTLSARSRSVWYAYPSPTAARLMPDAPGIADRMVKSVSFGRAS